jgi:hypothetical protein
MSPQVLPKVDVVPVRLASVHNHVQVVVRQARQRVEGLPTWDTAVTTVLIAEFGYGRDRLPYLSLSRDDYIKIDDWLGSEPWNRGAANVLDPHACGQYRTNKASNGFEVRRPCLVVDDHGRRRLHLLNLLWPGAEKPRSALRRTPVDRHFFEGLRGHLLLVSVPSEPESDGDNPRIFAQPMYLRAMNVVASLVIAFFVVGFALDRPDPSPLLVGTGWVVALLAVVGGIRAMASHVSLSEDTIRYRGVLRSRTLPVDQLLGLVRSRSLLARLAGYVPSLISRDKDGAVVTTNLWCFLVGRQALVGAEATEGVSEDLRLALEPFFRRNL